MSTGHRGEPKSPAELTRMLGEGDTPWLASRRTRLDTSCGVGYCAGISVDGKTVYIDARLYLEVMDGEVPVRGLSSRDVIQRWIDHEHTEWAIDSGDNPVDSYQGAHAFALAEEHRPIENPDRYEASIKPALERCIGRYPKNAPKDLWCGPYHDIAFGDDAKDAARAKEILRAYRDQGVTDAFKVSKAELHYGISDVECRECKHYGGGKLSTCAIVCGLVRNDRSCDRFEEK